MLTRPPVLRAELRRVVAGLRAELLDGIDRGIHAVGAVDPVLERDAVEQVVVVDVAHAVHREVAAADARVLRGDLDDAERAGAAHRDARREQLQLQEVASIQRQLVDDLGLEQRADGGIRRSAGPPPRTTTLTWSVTAPTDSTTSTGPDQLHFQRDLLDDLLLEAGFFGREVVDGGLDVRNRVLPSRRSWPARLSPVWVLVSVMSAPATTAPLGSRTVPTTPDSCAAAGRGASKPNRRSNTHRRRRAGVRGNSSINLLSSLSMNDNRLYNTETRREQGL